MSVSDTPCEAPRLPVPEPLRGSDTGSFTEKTIRVRFPHIARRTIEENIPWLSDIPAGVETIRKMEALVEEIPDTPLRLIDDPGTPDEADWRRYLERVKGLNWLQVSWFFAETYFYRRIMEAFGYFQPGPGFQFDPFGVQKSLAMQAARASLPGIATALEGWLGDARQGSHSRVESLVRVLKLNLWGNQADLSVFPFGSELQPDFEAVRREAATLLVDDSQRAAAYLLDLPQPRRVDFLVDNAGLELVYDLVLADTLLSSGLADSVQFHMKVHPTFVSDALIADVRQTCAELAGSEQPALRDLARRLDKEQKSGRFRLVDHFYWNSPLSGWEMPASLRQELGGAALIISKGDAHYRRLLGDGHWPPITPFTDIVCYLPAPLLALRVLKAELVAGLKAGQAEAAEAADPDWMVDGKWGMIQFTG